MLIPGEKIRAEKAILRNRGWVVLRGLPFTDGNRSDIPQIVEIAKLFGTPSERDGRTYVWPVRPLTDDPSQTFSGANRPRAAAHGRPRRLLLRIRRWETA